MQDNKLDDFLVKKYSKMIDNLNNISNDLLKAKIYLLLTYSAIGFAIKYSYELESKIPLYFSNIFICIIGNIVLWLVAEYIISHAFLFRYIQSNAAQIEYYFLDHQENNCFLKKLKELIKDPSAKNILNQENKFDIDYVIPDQFMPVYWGALFGIILNTILNICTIECKLNNIFYIFLMLIIALSLIFKIIAYLIYKLNKFHKEVSNLLIVKKIKNDFNETNFYAIPSPIIYMSYGFIIALILFTILTMINIEYYNYIISFIFLIYWYPILAISILLIKFITQFIDFDIFRKKAPVAIEHNNKIEIIFKENIYWILCLLYTIM